MRRNVTQEATLPGLIPSNHLVENPSKRERILATAYEILGHQGLENLHARTIGAELSLNHAAVHYYFKTREDLLVALVGYAHKRFEMDLERVVAPQPTPAKRLEAHIALYEAYSRPASRYFRALMSLFVAGAWSERIREAQKNLVENLRMKLEQHLSEAHQQGAVNQRHPMSNPDRLANYLFGLCVRSQMLGNINPTPEIDELLMGLLVQPPQ